MFKPNGRKLALALVATAVVSMLAACGGGADAPAAPVQATVASPDPTLAPTAAPPQVPPTVAPTVVPTATPEPSAVFDEFGFSLVLDRGAYLTSLPGNTATQGMVQLEYSGVNVILSWVPVNRGTNQGLVSGTFAMLQDSQPGLTLETVSEADISVGLEPALVLGFKSIGAGNIIVGGGLIGAWNCLDEKISFTMTVTGEDAAVVQLRFTRLADNFSCAAV